ncbi:hypothetical protein SEPCBS57363_002163 [Sporothrix epigloea]|uniref:Uncharacterized protein n=1 Tax=Sporothrix epigloea TaxID=1892477 RepID=A0ABP0DEB9_9PEZI
MQAEEDPLRRLLQLAEQEAERRQMNDVLKTIMLQLSALQPQQRQAAPTVASDTDPIVDTSAQETTPTSPPLVKQPSPAEQRSAFKQRTIASPASEDTILPASPTLDNLDSEYFPPVHAASQTTAAFDANPIATVTNVTAASFENVTLSPREDASVSPAGTDKLSSAMLPPFAISSNVVKIPQPSKTGGRLCAA